MPLVSALPKIKINGADLPPEVVADLISVTVHEDVSAAGEGVCDGRTDLRAGTVVKIEGLGERFSGLYYVTSTTHSYTLKYGYRMAFTVRRNAT